MRAFKWIKETIDPGLEWMRSDPQLKDQVHTLRATSEANSGIGINKRNTYMFTPYGDMVITASYDLVPDFISQENEEEYHS